MKRTFLMTLVCAAGISIVTLSSFAHHGYAAYDTDKQVTIKGAVTQWFWANPHCVLQLDVTDANGQVIHWSAETETPTTMNRMGWTRDSIKPGDQVTVTVLPVKNGKPIGRIVEVDLANGKKLSGRVNPATEVKPEESK